MGKDLSRRDFLKLAGLLSLGSSIPRLFIAPGTQGQSSQKENVLVVVFDAFSAYHVSLYGYKRRTTPHIDRLADKAIVYHNHFAGGNFTTPGTASLLTGTLPWTHRATRHNDTVAESFADKNIFQAFHQYHRLAYSHNPLANTLFQQFFNHIDDLTPREAFFLESDALINSLFKADEDIASVGWARALKRKEEGYSYSLFLSQLYETYKERSLRDIRAHFPRGLPYIYVDNYYVLEDGINGLMAQIENAPQPFLGYYHFYPPHAPYYTREDYYEKFEGDGYRPPEKPPHVFREPNSIGKLLQWRTWYDEFLLYIDAEFNRLYHFMEQRGLLENTWLVLTSDHGELFERGINGHLSPVLYQPVIKIPLLIFAPGGSSRRDVTSKTSAIDVLPTLMHVTGQEIPEWVEGRVMPPFPSSSPDSDRDIYALQVKGLDKGEPITDRATAMLVRGNEKLMYFFGYEDYKRVNDTGEFVELYNLEDDPEELHNLADSQRDVRDELLEALKNKLEEVNRPYQ